MIQLLCPDCPDKHRRHGATAGESCLENCSISRTHVTAVKRHKTCSGIGRGSPPNAWSLCVPLADSTVPVQARRSSPRLSSSSFQLTLRSQTPTTGSTPSEGCATPGSGAPLMQASHGNFYGTTTSHGRFRAGTAFRMTPNGARHHALRLSRRVSTGPEPNSALVEGRTVRCMETTEGSPTASGH